MLVLAVVAALGLFLWWYSDVRYFLRWSARRDQLERERRWSDLRAYYDANYRTLRPFVRLYRRFLIPGSAEIIYGTALHQFGEHEAALSVIERGVERARKEKFLRTALSLNALILDALGRYDEARRLAPEIVRLGGESAPQLVPVSFADLHQGKLDDALALLHKVITAHPDTDQARTAASRVLVLKGEFDAALRILDVEPSDGIKHFTPAGLAALHQFPDGPAVVERLRERHASIHAPALLLSITSVYLAAEDADGALATLERCRPLMAKRAQMEAHYHQLRAVASALAGNAPDSDESIAKMWEVVRAHPGMPKQSDWHSAAGLAALTLGRLEEARSLLEDALALARHPTEAHGLHCRLGDLHAKAGRTAEARAAYARVVADGFASRFHARARAALGETP